jgi:NADH-quinone oxidoreductase subunit L
MNLIYLAIVFPLLGVLINGFFGRRMPRKAVGTIASLAIFGSFLVSLTAFIQYMGASAGAYGAVEVKVLPWLKLGALEINYGFLVDSVSLVMALAVSLVSFLIHVYSTGYMADDDGYPRYFTYLNLFVAMMMTLVLADNLVLLFIGWEGVGLCSYLLIGFWYKNRAPYEAGFKAFVVNRIGDFGFLIATFLTFWAFHSVNFVRLRDEIPGTLAGGAVPPMLVTIIALFFFMGAVGKSAQFPLYVWLPDAMEGPTPVSALIHAATMVTAGVYLVTRLNFLFVNTATAMLVVAFIGAFTAIFAASIGLVQNDIKRVLAYSTVSQLGYMFLAAGLGAYWIAIFHLFTHAFFKALLFLASGSVIHGMHGEQDMRKMGGLAKYLPHTYWHFLIGAMAISGIPLLAGFFSKDQILFAAFTARPELMPQAGMILWVVGVITALFTSFYMFRQIYLVFLTAPRFDEHKLHPHEAPPSMLIPNWILAGGAVLAGYLGLPALMRLPNLMQPFLNRAILGTEHLAHAAEHAHELGLEAIGTSVSVVVAFAGLGLAFYLYRSHFGLTEQLKKTFAAPYRVLLNKYYVDELYEAAVIAPGRALSRQFSQVVDLGLIDGTVNLVAFVIGALGQLARPMQTGFIRNYAWYMGVGAILVIILLWLK